MTAYLDHIANKQLEKVEFMGSLTWIDFSQFEPRGHYTHSELLKKYFRAMMWLGRTDLVLTGTDLPRPREEAAARAIAGALTGSTAKSDFEAMDRFYSAFVGKTNALTPLALADLCEQAGLPACQGDAAAMASLYSQQTPPEYSSRVFAEAVPPIAMRFFPQRFAYCAWVMSQTTTPRLKPAIEGGRAMAMPEDVAFAFGNDRALEYYADDLKKPFRENLPATLEAVRSTMEAIPPSQLEATIMTEWMEGLRAQSQPTVDSVFPSVMRTPMWHDHKLETVLASWAELRHDTLLVVEQSTGGAGCQYPKGYVEPVPKLYQSLSRAADRLQQLYTVVASPDPKLGEFLDNWKAVLAKLESMSNKELASEPMSDEDLTFLNETADLHITIIVIDGVYTRQDGGTTRFHFVEPPSAQELASMVATICERVCRMLRRRGLMSESRHDSNEAVQTTDALDGCRTVALSRGRFERLDDQGRAQERLFADDEQGMRRKKDARWSADCKGFSLHAGVSFGALDRKGRERLVRYCTRPPLAMERLSVLRDGSVAYKLKWANKRSSHRVMRPMEFMARLAPIVAPPRLPLTRYHGVLAPNSSWRRAIVSAPRRSADESEAARAVNWQIVGQQHGIRMQSFRIRTFFILIPCCWSLVASFTPPAPEM